MKQLEGGWAGKFKIDAIPDLTFVDRMNLRFSDHHFQGIGDEYSAQSKFKVRGHIDPTTCVIHYAKEYVHTGRCVEYIGRVHGTNISGEMFVSAQIIGSFETELTFSMTELIEHGIANGLPDVNTEPTVL